MGPKKGQIIILTFVFFTVITILSATFFTKTTNFLRRVSASSSNELAFQMAEAGIDYAVWQINEVNGGFTGSTITLGAGTVKTEVTGSTTKEIKSTAYIPNETNKRFSRQAKVKIKQVASPNTVPSPFSMAVHTGEGSVTGSFSNPFGIFFGYCCGLSGDINGDAQSEGKMYADESAHNITGNATSNKTITTITVNGVKTENANPPVPALPNYTPWWQYAEQGAALGSTIPGFNTTSTGNITLGPTIVEGDVTLGSGNIYLAGPVWIKGRLLYDFGFTGHPEVAAGETASQLLLVDRYISISTRTIPLSPEGHFVMLMAKELLNEFQFAINTTSAGKAGAAFFVPNDSAQIGGDSNVAAAIAKALVLTGNNNIIAWNPALATARFEISVNWAIERGTYQLK